MRIIQGEVVDAALSIGKIAKLIVNEVANLLDANRAMEEIIEARGGFRIGRVVSRYEICCDTMMLFQRRY